MSQNFKTYRKEVQHVLNGPRDMKGTVGGERFYGWPYILLAVRAPTLDWQETRIIYANIYDKFQKYGVIRSILWNGTHARKLFREDSSLLALNIPAKFVVIPMERIHSHLRTFQRVSSPVLVRDVEPEIEIRRLRIERDHVTGVFERTWHLGSMPKSLQSLDKAWSTVWEYLGEDLHYRDEIEDIEEDFWIENFHTNYDLHGYNNKLFYEDWKKVHEMARDEPGADT